MTVPASYSESIGQRLPNTDEQECANQLRKILAAQMSDAGEVSLQAVLGDADIKNIILTEPLSKLLMDLLRVIGRGDAVTLLPVTQQLTTQQAADLLNVSRPYLIKKLLDPEEIPYTTVGRHRRISARDVFDYKKKMLESRKIALSKLAEIDADLL